MPDWEFSPRSVNQYSFAWQMQGDEALLPMQVFSTQDEVWVELWPTQTVPAILSIDPKTQQQTVQNVYRNYPYVVVKGHFAQLLLKRGDKEVFLWHKP
ncbi:TrbG/VirB9 family P-type conjugative transfer protein [Pelistega indica]|uniref:TrbG/VirB9 family P-type conjugative transfer protein n=1 Tax=Pelistega indica TaxID=1414851 RepID=UPI0021C3BA44|nr:TrbG/VirB9 family P-type conjugative transfer protein [Pelistega indica]